MNLLLEEDFQDTEKDLTLIKKVFDEKTKVLDLVTIRNPHDFASGFALIHYTKNFSPGGGCKDDGNKVLITVSKKHILNNL